MRTKTREPTLSAPFWMKCNFEQIPQRRTFIDDDVGFKDVNVDENFEVLRYENEFLKENKAYLLNIPRIALFAGIIVYFIHNFLIFI